MAENTDVLFPNLFGSLAQGGQGLMEGYLQGLQLRPTLEQQQLELQLKRWQMEQMQRQATMPQFKNLGWGAYATVDPRTGQVTPHYGPKQEAINPEAALMNLYMNPQTREQAKGFMQLKHPPPQPREPHYVTPTDRIVQKVAESGEASLTPGEMAVWNIYQRSKDKTEARTPPGYRSTPVGDLEAIPGGPADLKLQGTFNQDTSALNASQDALRRLKTEAHSLRVHPGLEGITGMRGAFPNIPGGQAADAQAKLQTLKSQIAFGVLQDMRANSKTGGALGNVSDAEGKRLESNLAALDQAQSIEQFDASLQQIEDYVDTATDRLANAYNLKYSGRQTSPASRPAPSGGKRGGKPLRIKGEADYQALPKGTPYIAPDGSTRVKR